MPSGLSLPELKSAPVPPSLVASPFLTSPAFTCTSEAPHIITEQDNLWLQDTVPVPMRTSSPGQSGSLKHSNSRRHVHFLRSSPAAPSSPPHRDQLIISRTQAVCIQSESQRLSPQSPQQFPFHAKPPSCSFATPTALIIIIYIVC